MTLKNAESFLGQQIGFTTITAVQVDPIQPLRRSLWFFTLECECGKVLTKSLRQLRTAKKGCSSACSMIHNINPFPRNNHLKEPGLSALRMIYSEYKRSAKARGKAFNLTFDQAKIFFDQNCYYCGRLPHKVKRSCWGDEYVYTGIDRVNNSIGYEVENCTPCCFKCNMAKHQSSKEEFIDWIRRLNAKFTNKTEY